MAKFELPPPPGRFVQVNGIRIHTQENGSGAEGETPLLLVHGLLAASTLWDNVVEALASRYRVIRLDLVGHGYSERRDDFSMALPDQAEVVAAFLDAIDVPRVHLVGQSMGGGISALVAARHPDRVERLVLVDPVCYPFKMPVKGKLATVPLLGRLIVTRVFNRGFMADFLRSDCFYDRSLVTERDIDERYAHFDSPASRRAAHRGILATSNPTWLAPTFGRIKAPTLIIWGSEDALIPSHLGKRLVSDIPDASLELIERCGHQPPVEAPEAFCDLVLAFLAKGG